ncbi:MAG: acetylornithine/succinylornithine family transaminase [Eubacteriales bacterium]|nr:acetylornithine/succinylornithine family transaminase [Eubacteriales bacterium]
MGATLRGLDGREYIDFTSGIGVNTLGFADEGYIQAVTEQLRRFQHISNYYVSPVTALLAEKLTAVSGMDRVFFGNSGAEANEGAIKTARKYSYDRYGEGRSVIISLRDSFHGRTVTTLAATGQDKMHNIYFEPFTEGFRYIPMGDGAALEEALTADVCAVIAEPIQGEGGVNVMDDAYAALLRRLCAERDILLIFDEVQCGMGRTGRMFAYEYFGFEPDIVTLAKGLGGGLPIGAFLCSKKCSGVLTAGNHGSTFGGNPVSAAAAFYVINRLASEGFLTSVTEKGAYIKSKIAAASLPSVTEIRGKGLMIGIAVNADPKEYALRAAETGLLVLTAGSDAVRLLPPLNITYDEIDRGLAVLIETLK